MSANHPCATSRCARTVWRCAAPLLMAILPATFTGLLSAQTQISSSDSLSEQLQAKLRRRGDLLLRDATLIEALFAIKENWGVNIVVGNEVKGAVNGAYTNAPLHEILDSILASQGYGYRVIGESLVITKLEHVGDWKPLFTTATLPLEHVPPEDVVDVIKFLLSPNGKAHAVPASKSVVVLDYADRIELVRTHLAKLEEAAAAAQTRAREEERRAAEDARREAQDVPGNAVFSTE
jgi:general secretion pathway protein D